MKLKTENKPLSQITWNMVEDVAKDEISSIGKMLNISKNLLQMYKDKTLKEFFDTHKRGDKDSFSHKGMKYEYIQYSDEEEKEPQISIEYDTPVKIEYQLKTLDTKHFPGVDDLKRHIQMCVAVSDTKDEKNFYQKALENINKEKIEVLQISDFNTVGLKFDETLKKAKLNKQPWLSVLKGSAISSKDTSNTANLGSHGKGKFSCFLLTDLRTVFYQSRIQDDKLYFSSKETMVERMFGSRSIFMEHNDPNDEDDVYNNIGFYCTDYDEGDGGKEYPVPVRNSDISNFFGVNEGETGLDIFIVGSMLSDNYANWKNEFIAALLSKFHVAIARDEFVAIVDGKEINSKSMKEIFADKTMEVDDKQALKEAKWLFELDSRKKPYTGSRPTVISDKLKGIPKFGDFEIKIMINDDEDNLMAELGKAKIVGWYRDGMYVTKHPSLRAKNYQFPREYPGFVASVNCLSPRGNEILRSLENPTHSDFFIPPDKVEQYKDACEALMSNVRKKIAEMIDAQYEGVDGESLPELDRIYAGVGRNEKQSRKGDKDISSQSPAGTSNETDINPETEEIKETGIYVRRSNYPKPPGPDPEPPGPGPDEGDVGGKKAKKHKPKGQFIYERVLKLGKNEYQITILPNINKRTEIKFGMSFDPINGSKKTQDTKVEIIKANTYGGLPCNIDNGFIKTDFPVDKKGDPVKMQFNVQVADDNDVSLLQVLPLKKKSVSR